MFIRRTITNSRKTSQAYYTYRLVEGIRTGNVVKQVTLLNLGSHFDLPQADWPALAARIDALLHGQEALQLEPLSEAVETMAQRCAAQLIARQPMEEPGASPPCCSAAMVVRHMSGKRPGPNHISKKSLKFLAYLRTPVAHVARSFDAESIPSLD